MKRLHFALVALALVVPSAQGFAKDKGKHKGKPVKVEKVKVDHVVFVDSDRSAYRNWWRSTYGANCPPGLARKDNGCLPPGLAKRRYVIGQPLPTTVVIGAVPSGLRLRAAPPGYRYAYVDGDLLLIDTTTLLVADVIAGILN